MSTTTELSEQEKKGHQFFAANLFNQSWSHLESLASDSEQGELALQAAYGSLYHWGKIGETVNLARGEWMIAHVATELARPAAALHHANRCLKITLDNGFGDFDLAYAYEGFARANALNGNTDIAKKYKTLAQSAGTEIKNEGDRKQFDSDFTSGNWYGI